MNEPLLFKYGWRYLDKGAGWMHDNFIAHNIHVSPLLEKWQHNAGGQCIAWGDTTQQLKEHLQNFHI